MIDFMDSRFYLRRILISNVCWILLTFLHDGVNCQPTLEVTGSGLINSVTTFTCSFTSGTQYYAIYKKNGTKIAIISNNPNTPNTVEAPYANRFTVSKVQNSTTENYIMTIDNLQCSDEGEYTCQVNVNTRLTETSKSLSVETMPVLPTLTAPSDFVVVGDAVTLECTALVGKPPRNLSLCVWQEGSFNCSVVSTLVDKGNCSNSRTATMTVNIMEDTNRATCEVVNPGGQKLEVSQNWEVYYPVLDIKFVPDISVVTLTEGESTSVTCEARGKPPATYKWDFEPDGSFLGTEVPQKTLTLTSVVLGQNGNYSCVASNFIRNVTYNMTKSITVVIVPTTPAPTTTTLAPTTERSSTGSGNGTKTGPQTNETNDDWKLIVSIVGAILFLIILLILLVILYRRRSKPAEIEEPPEKPRNNHEVNMKMTKPDLVYSTGHEKGKLPMYNTGFDHNGEDDLYYAELAFDDKPRSRKPIVPLYENSSNSDPYTTVMPQV